ncbi:uncharacterized protein B0P05DRAFT_480809, partial [Gilbertella persicaria]|uniref:uncharacterized protein n=1 Tax=Gilbertella persicaria TaxID=101096 RepID=UPI002220B856
PSDLPRIPFSSVKVAGNNTQLSFEVHAPKEKRRRRKVIKSFTIKAHVNSRVRPASPFFFIDPIRPDDTRKIRRLYSWIKRLFRLSSDEPRLSLRSLALQSGIPKENIVTMGNWSSSTIFEYHHRKEHLSHFDLTHTLVQISLDSDDDGLAEDVFFDAADSL